MMKVLIITNKRDITSDFIVRELKKRGTDYYRFNTEDLNTVCSVVFDFQKDKFIIIDKILEKEYNIKSFTSVYYRRPEIPDFDDLPISKNEKLFLRNENIFVLEGLYKILRNAFWINSVFSIREAENKIYQLLLAKEIGFRIPKSVITNYYDYANSFYDKVNGSCVIKPIKSGLVGNNDDSKVIFTSEIKERRFLKEQIERSPIYFQNLIKKKFDLRVIIVGNKVFSTLIHSQDLEETKIDWRKGEKVLKHTKYQLPKKIKKLSLILLKNLKLNYGALDFILDEDDNVIFLEINPNGQWAWIEQRTGHQISNEIVNLLENGKV